MLKLDPSQENVSTTVNVNEVLKGKAVEPEQYPGVMQGGFFDYAGAVDGSPADYLVNNNQQQQDYYYYQGSSGGQVDPVFFNWQLTNGANMHDEYDANAYGYVDQHQAHHEAPDYDYGMYNQQSYAGFYGTPSWYQQQGGESQTTSQQTCLDGYEMSIPVKMPDAMLYPALDECAIADQIEQHYPSSTAGIFNDYFNLSGLQHHHQQNYLNLDDSIVSHVRPTDVISAELFQSMQVPMVPIYGHFQASSHHMDQTYKPSKQPGKLAASQPAKKKKKTPAMFGQSFFSVGKRPSEVGEMAGQMEMRIGGDGALPGAMPSVVGEDGVVYVKPAYSYAALISRALRECNGSKLTLSGIYDWIKENFPYYRTAEAAWQVQLSILSYFIAHPNVVELNKAQPILEQVLQKDPSAFRRTRKGRLLDP